MTGLMFVINAKVGACPSYRTFNPRFDHNGSSLLSRLLRKNLDTFKYYVLYNFASRMSTDPVFTAIAFHRCREVDWVKTAVRDGFGSYDFFTGEVSRLSEKAVKARTRVRVVDRGPGTVTLDSVPVTFSGDVSRVDLSSVRQDYDHYRWREGSPGEVECGELVEVLIRTCYFEKDWL